MEINKEDLLEIVRNDIKNIKCKECGKFPESVIKDELVDYDIKCDKQCSNRKDLNERIFKICEYVVKQY